MISDEQLMAFSDGELDAGTSALIEEAMQHDSELRARVAQHRALRADIYSAFLPIIEEPIPAQLQSISASAAVPASVQVQVQVQAHAPASMQTNAKVIPLAPFSEAQQRRKEAQKNRWSWPEWGALAATLILGVIAGRVGTHEDFSVAKNEGIINVEHGTMLAQGVLAQQLTQQLASANQSDTGIKIGVSFLSKDGSYCRSFMANGSGAESGVSGLACKSSTGATTDSHWQIAMLAQNPALATNTTGNKSDAYRLAGTEMPMAVLQAIDERIADQTLDAAGERAALQNGWRKQAK